MSSTPAQYLFQPRLQQLVVYYDFARPEKNYGSYEFDRKKNFKEAAIYAGDISKGGQKKLKRAIETLYVITPTRKVYNRVLAKHTNFKLSHLTLTLSGNQGKWSDKDINKYCLQPFLLNCKRKFGLTNYVWKAERQDNGNLHYHIISDLFFDLELVRRFWNDKQDTLGLIDEFEMKYGHRQPPSIELKYVRNADTLGKYISKYISKTKKTKPDKTKELRLDSLRLFNSLMFDENFLKLLADRRHGLISGRVWDCSEKLKSFKYQATSLSSSEEAIVNELLGKLTKSRFDGDYFSVINFNDDNWLRDMPGQLKQTFINQYRDLLDQERLRFMEKRNKLNEFAK